MCPIYPEATSSRFYYERTFVTVIERAICWRVVVAQPSYYGTIGPKATALIIADNDMISKRKDSPGPVAVSVSLPCYTIVYICF